MSDDEDDGPEEQLRVAAEYGQALLRQNEPLQRAWQRRSTRPTSSHGKNARKRKRAQRNRKSASA